MNRRGFFQWLGMAAASLTIDPEELLWVPGKKTMVVMPGKEWNPTLNEINQITLKYITPGLVDAVFRHDKLFDYLRESERVFRKDYRQTS